MEHQERKVHHTTTVHKDQHRATHAIASIGTEHVNSAGYANSSTSANYAAVTIWPKLALPGAITRTTHIKGKLIKQYTQRKDNARRKEETPITNKRTNQVMTSASR